MTASSPAAKDIDSKHLDVAEAVLTDLTDRSEEHDDPKAHLHTPGNQEAAHSWFRSVFPYVSLEDFENQWHLGNYVIDRQICQKSFEPMSIYVRVGMHLLYYGSEQQNVLQWKRTQRLLKEQSIKMGRQYDSPESRKHIRPFIESFHLQDTLKDLVSEAKSLPVPSKLFESIANGFEVQPNPRKYPTFNAFFAREIQESARPIAEPDDDKIVSSLADCRLSTYATIGAATKYWIKGFGFTLPKLIGSVELAHYFKEGSILIHRLAPQDYHRWHAPTSGTVVSITEIPGT